MLQHYPSTLTCLRLCSNVSLCSSRGPTTARINICICSFFFFFFATHAYRFNPGPNKTQSMPKWQLSIDPLNTTALMVGCVWLQQVLGQQQSSHIRSGRRLCPERPFSWWRAWTQTFPSVQKYNFNPLPSKPSVWRPFLQHRRAETHPGNHRGQKRECDLHLTRLHTPPHLPQSHPDTRLGPQCLGNTVKKLEERMHINLFKGFWYKRFFRLAPWQTKSLKKMIWFFKKWKWNAEMYLRNE